MIMASPLKALVLLLSVFLVFEPSHQNSQHYRLITNPSLLNSQSILHSFTPAGSDNTSCSNTLPKQNTCSSSADCPTWFVCNDTHKCQCGPGYQDSIKCDVKRMVSAVMNCYCVTYNEASSETYDGLCFYNCERPLYNKVHPNVYHNISNKTTLNDFMCGYFNRTGILCGECKQGLSPFVLSYNLSCVECPDGHKNWWKFVLVGFVPLTIFYFTVVFLNINVTSSRLHGFIIYSQALSTPALVRLLLIAVEEMPLCLKGLKLIESFYGIWNLDPFRSLLPDICLNIDTLQSFALDACIAVYPLMLIILSYLLIELYDRNIWCIVFMWRPFHLTFRLFRENWDIRTSVIDSFATFFLLSYVKILSVSVDLMLFTTVHELGSNKHKYRLYYAASIEFLEGYHIPYASLSMVSLIFMITIPTLILIFYPFRCFQRCLSHCRIRWHFLHVFVDTFQGCYKDGTEPGTFDLRWFSAYGLVLRIGVSIIYILTLSSMYFIYALIMILSMIILLINFQPYKDSVANYTTLDASFLILLSLVYTSIVGVNSKGQRYLYILYFSAMISSLITIFYIIFISLHWIFSRRKWGRMLLTRVKALLDGLKQ